MASIIITDNDIVRLVAGRSIINLYKERSELQPESITTFEEWASFELKKIGFMDRVQFGKWNRALNVIEYDRCYRMRHLSNLSIETPLMAFDDFCQNGSGCISRGYPCCIPDMDLVNCYNEELILKYNLTLEQSEIAQEYIGAASLVGANLPTLILPYPLIAIGYQGSFPDTHTPYKCNGKMIKITEPRFDLFWGMSFYRNVGNAQTIIRKRIIDNELI